jgi:4-hydroxy 2-oxovalerate aldolase
MKLTSTPSILECTLRDGAYVVDFQFTAEDTYQIARRLDALGFPFIEIGHGLGLGATRAGMGKAAATDIGYMEAASKAVTNGKWGMFCIPGIACLDDIDIAADHGVGFIRIGTEIDQVEGGAPFIERALKKNILVCSNLMKSYLVTPDKFGAQAQRCYDWGASVVYIVDSAGGMLPNEIRAYIEAARSANPKASLGFHGHNNLGLAVANSLLCAELGVQVIDTSLQGLGRSAGNTPSSQLLCALMRHGFVVDYDVIDVMQAGEELARHLIRNAGYDTLDMTCGLALFHSGHLPKVLAKAKEHQVDPRRLILELCKLDRINAHEELLEKAAHQAKLQS